MKTLMLSLGVGSSTDSEGHYDDGSARRNAAFSAAFELGQAWHGGQLAIFLRTDKTIPEVFRHVGRVIDDRDFLLVVELAPDAEVSFAGPRFDEEGFAIVFPKATETKHQNRW